MKSCKNILSLGQFFMKSKELAISTTYQYQNSSVQVQAKVK